MTLHLVVIKPFLGFTRGDIIADVAKIQDIMSSDYKRCVRRVASSDPVKG
jgi:hypothetical protein